jgi:hypothetical protein
MSEKARTFTIQIETRLWLSDGVRKIEIPRPVTKEIAVAHTTLDEYSRAAPAHRKQGRLAIREIIQDLAHRTLGVDLPRTAWPEQLIRAVRRFPPPRRDH